VPAQQPLLARRNVLGVLAATSAIVTLARWRAVHAGDAPPDATTTLAPAGGGRARLSNLAATNLLLAGAAAGSRIVAVGEYGHVLLSDDGGATWRQATEVPTRTTLTAVTFVDARYGWAVGHGGIVIGTADAGETWRLLSGRIDGKDALFSVWFGDTRSGLVVGSYGYAARSNDGGATWASFEIASGELGERHLNQIIARGRVVLIAAEGGIVFRSLDGGAHFEAVKSPYKGSLWGGAALTDGSWLLWGMRGTVLRSADDGRTWTTVASGTEQSLSGGAQRADGTILIAGLNGVMLTSRDGGATFQTQVREDRRNTAAVVASPRGFVLLGPNGASPA
jgi:photosystem II stability/assembly factor-like uncharacterized protein